MFERHQASPPSTVLKTKIDFYEERYDSQTAKEVEPFLFGDALIGSSTQNAMLGEFLVGIGFGQEGAGEAGFVADSASQGVFDTFDNANFAQTIDGDNFTVVGGTLFDGQKGKDVVIVEGDDSGGNQGGGNQGGGNTNVPVDAFARTLFYNHSMIVQWNRDMYMAPVLASSLAAGVKDAICSDPVEVSLIPPFVLGGHDIFDGRGLVENAGCGCAGSIRGKRDGR